MESLSLALSCMGDHLATSVKINSGFPQHSVLEPGLFSVLVSALDEDIEAASVTLQMAPS